MEIKRDVYLDKLIRKKKNGLIKVVTGVRRCGKSYLLFHLFHDHLLDSGVAEDHIIEIALDDRSNKELRDPDVILKFIKESIKDKEDYYIILDEVQYLDEFEDVLNSLLHIRNADVYVTGSNSKFLSSDVITQFRGRGDEIRVYPLSFSEYVSVYQGSQDEAWDDYLVYGGLPLILTMEEAEDKPYTSRIDLSCSASMLAVAVFDIYQHSKAVFKRNVLKFRIVKLITECICHCGKTHFNKFIYCALICHI